MPTIDLFNKTADEAKISAAILDGSFHFNSKLYAKYLAKSAAQGIIVGGVLTLASVGALVIIADKLDPNFIGSNE
jgi:hypothetical protein